MKRSRCGVLPVLFRMERNGVLLDAAKLEAQSHELGKESWRSSRGPTRRGQLSTRLPKQIQEILFERQKLREEENPFGAALNRRRRAGELALEHPMPTASWSTALSKLKSTYTTSCEERRCAHGARHTLLATTA